MTVLPYYKRFPAAFLRGIQNRTVEQIAVYAVLLELMYDAWATVEDRTPKQRRDLAAMCGLSVRKFGTTLDELLGLGKLHRTSDGRISNRKFERLAKDLGVDLNYRPDYRPDNRGDNLGGTHDREGITPATPGNSGKKPRDYRPDNRGDPETALNGNKDLSNVDSGPRARANIEPRTQNLDRHSTGQGQEGTDAALSPRAEQVIESEISQICTAIGVDLQASTHRHMWPARWVEMRDKHRLTVGDMVAAIASYGQQLKGDSVKSLGLYQARAIERRTARELSDRIAGRARETVMVSTASINTQQWHAALAQFIRIGTWDSSTFGPSPLHAGCAVPDGMLDKAEQYWIANGNHPEAMHHGGARVAWQPGKAGSVREVTPFYRSKVEA